MHTCPGCNILEGRVAELEEELRIIKEDLPKFKRMAAMAIWMQIQIECSHCHGDDCAHPAQFTKAVCSLDTCRNLPPDIQ